MKRVAIVCIMLALSVLLARTNDWIPVAILWSAFVASVYSERLQ